MKEGENYQIITFYEFKFLGDAKYLAEIRNSVKNAMLENSILGTVILAAEGFNSAVCGRSRNIRKFISEIEAIFDTTLNYKSSLHTECPFEKAKVRIKSEIVTLKQKVEIEDGRGTHAQTSDWNKIISDPEMIILDARDDYEVRVGSFKGAINPQIEKFSDLPEFIGKNFSPEKHKKIAMFCTGGIRCEKFAPFMKNLGFETVYQLEGGILRYLEEIPESESLWEGECFVFDERITVDEKLQKGREVDLSQKIKFSKLKNPK